MRQPLARASARAIAATAALCAIAPAHAQQQPVFRSGTSVVEINVVVRDRDGRFVQGLTAEDFTVLEGGQPRRIDSMYLVAAPDAAGRAAEAAGTARLAPRTFIFAFDIEQLAPRSLTRAREAVSAFASERLVPGDLSGVAVLGGRNEGRIDQDRTALLALVAALKPSSAAVTRDRALREWPRVLSYNEAAEIVKGNDQALGEARDRACEEMSRGGGTPLDCVAPGMRPGAAPPPAGTKSLGGFEQEANRESIEQQLRGKSTAYIAETRAVALRSIAALESLAQAVEGIRGRKTIVWFTEGTPVLEAANQARQATARAAQAGVAIYTIDPQGLQSSTAGVEEVATQDLGHEIFGDTGDLPAMMASGTGAMFIRNENNLARALARVDDDTSSYYVIGYATDEAARANRRVSVRVTRAGIDARVRYGFTAPQHAVSTVGSMVAAALETMPGVGVAVTAPEASATTGASRPATSADDNASAHVVRLRGSTDALASDAAARAWSAYERGNLEAALPLFEQAARGDDVRPWVLYAMGFTYVGLGRDADALAAWERVRAAEPDFMPVYLDLAAHYARDDEGKALAVLREASRRWPSDPEPLNGIGVLLAKRTAFGEAIVSFTKAVQAAPDDALSWLNLGRTYELRYDRARRYDEMLLKWVGPEGDRVKARESYERCVKLGGPYATQAAEALSRMAWS